MSVNILVADDDPAMLHLYTLVFSGTDYSISMASSFAEAEKLIGANSYDLLVADLMLGDGLGTELIALFEKKRCGAKSLLVSGSVAELDLEPLPETYIEKPFRVEVFLSAVAKALS